MTRLTKLDNDDYRYLSDDDHCYHYGEYTSGGGFKKSTTNQQILNLKNKPTSSDGALYYKRLAVEYWGKMIAETLNLAAIADATTFVPMPCSKPVGHADYDDRMHRVLRHLLRTNADLDIRPVLIQTRLRPSQHEAGRQTPAQLLETLGIDQSQTIKPLRSTVVILDDVITMGASFSAAKSLITQIPGVTQVIGIFLAKTVWDRSELDDFLGV